MHIDRQPDDIASKTFYILDILIGVFCKLDLPRIGYLEPGGEINSTVERGLGISGYDMKVKKYDENISDVFFHLDCSGSTNLKSIIGWKISTKLRTINLSDKKL